MNFVSSDASESELETAPPTRFIDFSARQPTTTTSRDSLSLACERVHAMCTYLLNESPYKNKVNSIGHKRTLGLRDAVAAYRNGALTPDGLIQRFKEDLAVGRLIRQTSDISDDVYRHDARLIDTARQDVFASVSPASTVSRVINF